MISYALRLFTVPTGFLAAPLATVIYPEFVRYAARKQFDELRLQTLGAVRLAVFLFFPITIWTILNALPLTRLLYERGQFHLADSLITSKVLALYSIGILPNAVAIVLLRCFYAVNDTITPLVAETIDLAYYIVVATLLSRHFGLNGLAITRGGAFFVVAAVLITVALRRRTMLMFDFAFLTFLFRTAAASLLMAAISWMVLHLLQSIFDAGATLVRALVVLAILTLSASAFLLAAYCLDLEESKRIIRMAASLLIKCKIMRAR
jgi:putative peptidoglycan lipid II flippase